MTYRATYHIHVTVRGGSGLEAAQAVTVNRSAWQGVSHRTSQGVITLPLRESPIDGGTPIDQAIACAEAALEALVEYREGLTPEAYDHP